MSLIPKSVEGVSVAAAFAWPVVALVELDLGINFGHVALALAAGYFVGGRQLPWDATFQEFFRGYLAAAGVIGLSTYYQLKRYQPAAERVYREAAGDYDRAAAFAACARKARDPIAEWKCAKGLFQ